jgi:hypothetical protein
MTFGRTKVERGIGLASAPLFGGLGLFCGWVALDPARFGARTGNWQWPAMWLFFFVALSGVAVFFATLSVAREVEIFPSRRSFRLTEGRRVREGTYSDLGGLRFWVQESGKTGSSCFVSLRITGSKDVALFCAKEETLARQELERLCEKLSLPIIEG